MASSNQENFGTSIFGNLQFQRFGLPAKSLMELAKEAKKLGQDDPRRIVHSLKAGLALILVSLFYYIDPLYSTFGDNTTWAVMTAVVIFEFSVGATLGKSVNRMIATLGGGALSIGVCRLATVFGNTGKAIVIDIFVFAIAAMVTFARFFPKLKARCDYGLMIFILTFSLISVSSYRDDNIAKMALERLSTIVVGCCATILVSICICPVWIGEDLHKLVALNIEKLGKFLEGFGGEYFGLPSSDRSFLQGYRSVLNSQSSEENMANLAKWEPGHGRFRFFHPWKQYLTIGSLTRQCAIKIDVLNNYLNPQIQVYLYYKPYG
ncbi:aluminum-activated malate transporter 2 [Manihot esculenta]|uniref:aluminum-activated malate transporter 2 n=1 Tax=Manihot esculenta TaxID=3983 RepID=UPI000B5D082E|nr:aluminum-activated malate transporter 2 [Manihot esculenta]